MLLLLFVVFVFFYKLLSHLVYFPPPLPINPVARAFYSFASLRSAILLLNEGTNMASRTLQYGFMIGLIWLCPSGLIWRKESRAILDRVKKMFVIFSNTCNKRF